MKPILFVISGISGIGKSHYCNSLAKEHNATVVETDALRKEITGDASNQSCNATVFQMAEVRVASSLSARSNTIIDATSLTVWERKKWVEIANRCWSSVECHYFSPNKALAKKQNALRDRKVPEHVIDKQSSKFVVPTLTEGFAKIVKVQ